jgi:thiamine biosynthesis protein ThiS
MNAQRSTLNAQRSTIIANGRPESVELPCSLAQFLTARGLDPRQVAVERNGEVLFKSAYDSTHLQDGDRLEIVKVVAGG